MFTRSTSTLLLLLLLSLDSHAREPQKSSPVGSTKKTAAVRARDFGIPFEGTPGKFNAITDVAVLEHAIREDLNKKALRRLAVLRPIRVIITNYPEDQVEQMDAVNNPEDPGAGSRKIPFSRELLIESADFMETPPPKYFRLKPGGEVRLKYAYIIKCNEVMKDANGSVIELHCTADLESKSGGATSNRKIKGTIHWVSAAPAVDAEVRLYDRLFTVPEPDAEGDFKSFLNRNSLEIVNAITPPPASHPATTEGHSLAGEF